MSTEIPDNVFDLAAGEPELLDGIQHVEQTLTAQPVFLDEGGVTLRVIAGGGNIKFRVPQVSGSGSCSSWTKGVGRFHGEETPFQVVGGTFELAIDANSATLTLRSGGRTVFGPTTYIGAQRGSVPWSFSLSHRILHPIHWPTRDWALIELYNDKFDWSTFKGNKVYIGGNLSSLDYGKFMFPHPRTRPTTSTLKTEECLLVVKHGLATGTTIGRVTGMESFTRKFNEYGIKKTVMEIAVLPYGSTHGPFSAPGDSGSIVLDRKGRILRMLNGGAGSIDKTDITYLTPYSYIEKDIKKYFPRSILY
ncbi:hypothetical protein CPB84DRAFT_1845802 [Gymnopilus junonius]|uniref:Uncharacterized protein n=1 Tax=Gymnopilus junonius TaxID=109634 RepID=A0A9P5NTV5_GYMJU|nr:hypothetical protein CPB84DRAFT_1845802 [Gymnopilus junonius]